MRLRAALFAIGLSAGLAAPPTWAVVAESEPNARGGPDRVPAQLPPFTSAFVNGSALVTGSLTAGDVDFYVLQLTAGQLLLVGAFDEQGGELADVRVGVFFEAPSASDPASPPAAENDDGGPGFLSRLAVPIDQSGTWKIGVTGFRDLSYTGAHLEARDAPIAYRLALAVTTATPARVESEPSNDDAAGADLLVVGGAVLRGALGPEDRDWSAIDLAEGEDVTFSLFDLASGAQASEAGERNDTRIALYGPNGQTVAVAENDDGGPGFLSNLAFRVPAGAGGVHRLALSGYRDFAFQGDHLTGPMDYALVVAAERTPRCDVNGDAFIDQADINAIFAARGQPASGPSDPRDADGNGTITILDSRACTLQCGSANCAPQTTGGCGLLGPEALLALAPVWRLRRGRSRRTT